MSNVNIIIPIYKKSFDLVKKLIASIQDQDLLPKSVTCVCDGDEEIFKQLQKEYFKNGTSTTAFPLFLELLKENKGASFARNYGAKISGESLSPTGKKSLCGEYLFFIDADCKLNPGMLNEMASQLDDGYDVVYGNFTQGMNKEPRKFIPFCEYRLETENYINTMSMVRRSSFNKVKGFNIDLQFFQDYDLWYRISKTGAKFKYINDTIFHTECPQDGDISSIPKTLSEKAKVFRQANNLPDKTIVVASHGAAYQALQRAKMLNADYTDPIKIPYLNYENWKATYMVGLYNQSVQGFMNHVNVMVGKKIFHLIGTDVSQFLTQNTIQVVDAYIQRLESENAVLFANSPRLVREMHRCGFKDTTLLYTPIYEIEKYKSINPLPETFTIGVYFTDSNPFTMLNPACDTSHQPLIMEVAKMLPHINFKFFGGTDKYTHKSLGTNFPENIEFCGRIAEDNMVEFINSCSAIIRSTSHDGFPQSPIHFMLCGRQAIVSCPDEEMKYAIKLKKEKVNIKNQTDADETKEDMLRCIKQAYDNPDCLLNKTEEIHDYYKNLMCQKTYVDTIYGCIDE